MNINETAQEIYNNNVAKGFWEEGEKRNTGEMIALVHSELSEALEAHRNGKMLEEHHIDTFKELIKDIDNSTEEGKEEYRKAFKSLIKDSFEDELADAVIRIFDIAKGKGIDIAFHIRAKMNYNATRPYKHNKSY